MTEADRYLLEQIRRGDAEGWAALVSRYQGRLLAFARGRLRQPADAEDIVQDTFFHFLKGLPAFRQDASVETYLFTILRRKLVDHFRGKHMRLCSLQEVLDAGGGSGSGASSSGGGSPEAAARLAGPDPGASWYARRDEQAGLDRSALAAALGALLDRLKESGNLRDLRVIEMLFYGQLRNKDVAAIAGIDEKHVALIKHRALNAVREHVAGARGPGLSSAGPPAYGDSMVTEVWEEQRLTCPKRSTIGRYLLGTLEGPWQEHVDFHVNRLGCRFCRANLDDLQKKSAEEESAAVRDRILHSTIGFFKK